MQKKLFDRGKSSSFVQERLLRRLRLNTQPLQGEDCAVRTRNQVFKWRPRLNLLVSCVFCFILELKKKKKQELFIGDDVLIASNLLKSKTVSSEKH